MTEILTYQTYKKDQKMIKDSTRLIFLDKMISLKNRIQLKKFSLFNSSKIIKRRLIINKPKIANNKITIRIMILEKIMRLIL